MGNHHTSHDHNSSPTTSKLILEDGELREFNYPVRVSDLVNKSLTFICRADDLDYDHYISAIDGEEELEIGEIYFLLPLDWLKKPLRALAMAALAVKASLALNNRVMREKRPAVDCGGERKLAVKKGRRGGGQTRRSRNLSVVMGNF